MTKIRVHELAKKLGIENKELIDQLEHAGVVVKSHASVLEDTDLQKFESAKQAAEAAAEVKVDDRITSYNVCYTKLLRGYYRGIRRGYLMTKIRVHELAKKRNNFV